MPHGEQSLRYHLADLIVDVGRRAVRRGASDIRLSKLSFDLLRTLIEAAPNIVSNEELARSVWHGVVVGPETVTQRVKLLRDALGDDPGEPRYIAGLRGQGYRILPPVTLQSSDPGTTTSETPAAARRTRSRMVPTVVVATALSIALLYVFVDQVLTARHGEASQPTTSNSAVVAFQPPPHSIAVLPFVNLSGDKEQEYFSDGLTEELLNSLAHIDGLQVAAGTSSFSFKGHPDIADAARKLNVSTVLAGSVRRSGHTVRISAQLINAVTGFHVWSNSYDRDLGDVLKLQTEIATAVAGALKVTLLGDIAQKIELGGTRNPAAFDAYLRASKAMQSGGDTANDAPVAIAAYTEAIRLDPNYALAFAGRSYALATYLEEVATGATYREIHERFEKAKSDARRAVALAPELAEAHSALGYVFQQGDDFARASEEYERAVALAPGNAQALRLGGEFAALMGHFDTALAALRRAVVLDPLDRASYTGLGRALYAARRYGEAATALTEAISLNPDYKAAYGYRGFALYGLGDFESARASCETKRDDWTTQWCLAVVYEKLGRRADAEAEVAKLKAVDGETDAYQYATSYAQWGERTKALEWLDTAMPLRDPGLINLKTDPLMDPLRKEPRFQAIERALKFPN